MITKKVNNIRSSKDFFNTTFNTIEDGIGLITVDYKHKELMFGKRTLDIINDTKLFSDEFYPFSEPLIDQKLLQFILDKEKQTLKENTEFDIIINGKDLNVKLEFVNEFTINFYIIDIGKILETEGQLTKLNKILETGSPIYTACTWWIDYDKYGDHFFQSDTGPRLLGIEIADDMLYNTKEFGRVRERAAKMSPFYDECIKAEAESYERVRYNKVDYFAGRSPALTADDKEVWVESYGKCILRYKDGRPRFFVAIDIYLSDLLENSNQLTELNSLIDKGLMNADVGVWYYQKYHNEGRYYFTESHIKIMKVEGSISNENISARIDERFANIIKHSPEYAKYLLDWRTTHQKIFTEGLDTYTCVLPNHEDPDNPQWIEVRGTVIERDKAGEVRLFIGVNVDVTQTVQRNIELERLRLENEHLQLAEKLAIKSGNVLVWYQDFNLIKENQWLFGNEIFTSKLGVKRNEDGLIPLRQLHKSINKGNKKSRELAKTFIEELNKIYSYQATSMKNILVKHYHLETGEEMYFEHTVEVEERFEDGRLKLVGGFMRDVTENFRNQRKIQYLANNDLLTGLRNRNYFDSFINSDRLPSSYSVLLFDVDGLKLINDAFGHLEGDRHIKQVANWLSEIFTDSFLSARIGGDEFVILSHDIDPDSITFKANQLEAKIEEFNKNSHTEINVSKGGKVIIAEEESFERAFINAENLMYRRKLMNRSSRKSKTLESIIETLNAKTEETKDHSDRIGELAVKVMAHLGFERASEKEDMRLLARVHDVGKITIPDYILNKPGKLTDEEYEIVKKHSEAGYKIIKNITDSDFVAEGVLSHHERWDGLGYPQGIKGTEIPIYARILSVCDSYDAMIEDRVYRDSLSEQEALEEIKKNKGTQFDPDIVDAFLKVFNEE